MRNMSICDLKNIEDRLSGTITRQHDSPSPFFQIYENYIRYHYYFQFNFTLIW